MSKFSRFSIRRRVSRLGHRVRFASTRKASSDAGVILVHAHPTSVLAMEGLELREKEIAWL